MHMSIFLYLYLILFQLIVFLIDLFIHIADILFNLLLAHNMSAITVFLVRVEVIQLILCLLMFILQGRNLRIQTCKPILCLLELSVRFGILVSQSHVLHSDED